MGVALEDCTDERVQSPVCDDARERLPFRGVLPDERQIQMFSINVGGTFTDCFYRSHTGQTLRHKVLSSGVTKGGVAPGSDRRQIVDFARRANPDQFWNDYTLRLLDGGGRIVGESRSAIRSPDRRSPFGRTPLRRSHRRTVV